MTEPRKALWVHRDFSKKDFVIAEDEAEVLDFLVVPVDEHHEVHAIILSAGHYHDVELTALRDQRREPAPVGEPAP